MSETSTKKHSLIAALRIVWRLVSRYLGSRRGWLAMLLSLSILLIAGQVGLIVTILEIVDRIVTATVNGPQLSTGSSFPAETGFVDQILTNASALLQPLETPLLLGLGFAIYLAFVLTQYATSLLTVHINLTVFKSTMTDLASVLLQQQRQSVFNLSAGETSGLFTRGARYSGIICGRTAGTFPALISLPFLLVFALLLAPKLFGMMALCFVLLLPLQYFIMREGLNATQGLLASAAKHGQGKKQLYDVLSFADQSDLPSLEEIERRYVNDPSQKFLGFYKRRRLLGARAHLLSAFSIGIVGAIILASLTLPNTENTVPLGGVIVFLVTLQFLASAFSKIAVFITTTSSLAPLMGPIDSVLFGNMENRSKDFSRPDVSPLEALLSSNDTNRPTPQAYIFGADMAHPQYVLNCLSGPNNAAALVSVRLPSVHGNIARNLGLVDEDAVTRFKTVTPPEVILAFDRAICAEGLDGFSQALWDSLPPSLLAWASLSTALAKKQRIIILGSLAGTIGQSMFNALCQAISGAGLECIQVMASPPKRMKKIKGSTAFHLGAKGLVVLTRANDDLDQIPAITEALAKIQTQPAEQQNALIDEEEELLEGG